MRPYLPNEVHGEGTCVDTNGLRWGDAGAEALRMVLPAVDLLDGPDKDPFPDSRHAKPGGVERVNVNSFTGLLRQNAQKRVML